MAAAPGKVAIVLSGGGARGAYEAGVLRFIREILPKRLGFVPRFYILCGTSAGAINATFLAATADRPDTQASRLVEYWRSLELAQVLKLNLSDLLRVSRSLLSGTSRGAAKGDGGLLESSGLQRFVIHRVPWSHISTNIEAGHLEALSVSLTHVASGATAVFVERKGASLPPWSRDPFVRAVACRIGPAHVLASAAIPVLFPPVEVGGAFYCDGGLRQNTPLSPALRLGADRVLVISLRHLPSPEDPISPQTEEPAPTVLDLFGKSLNALLLDHTDYDLDRLHRFNAILAGGTSAFGPTFIPELNRVLIPMRGQGMRVIQDLMIRPSQDVGELAATHAQSPHLKSLGGLTGRALRYLMRHPGEADLLSYLLFDGEYAAELVALGTRDAAAREDELAAFFEGRAA